MIYLYVTVNYNLELQLKLTYNVNYSAEHTLCSRPKQSDYTLT